MHVCYGEISNVFSSGGRAAEGWQEIDIPFLGVVPVEVTFKDIIEGRFVKDDVMKQNP